MIKITVKVEGMMCGHCEAHMNEAVQKAWKVESVTSSHSAKETVIITDAEITDEQIKEVVEKAGYTFCGIDRAPYKKSLMVKLFGK